MAYWVDVCGPPGAGKSTICNPIWHEHSITWDGHLLPLYWRQFVDEITVLFGLIKSHWSFEPAIRMNNRSARKMATVERMVSDKPYVQTGLVQRGLGFAWRLNEQGSDVNLVRRYFELMPVSIGVAFLTADQDTLAVRNKAREQVAATAHENRTYQVKLYGPGLKIAKEVLRDRGVPLIEVDVQHQSPDEARAQLIEFSKRGECELSSNIGQFKNVLGAPPQWWK